MSDDDLIRDAVHELVGAAPAPKPLPDGRRAGGRLVPLAGGRRGGDPGRRRDRRDRLAAIRRRRRRERGDHHSPAGVDAHRTRSPANERRHLDDPGHCPRRRPTRRPRRAPPRHRRARRPPRAPPPRPRRPRRPRKRRSLQDYLTALADGRYADAAVLLNEGGLEPERRADLRPLFTEYGDIDDLPARLQSWCDERGDLHRTRQRPGRHRRVLGGDVDDAGAVCSPATSAPVRSRARRASRAPTAPQRRVRASLPDQRRGRWCARPTSTPTACRRRSW